MRLSLLHPRFANNEDKARNMPAILFKNTSVLFLPVVLPVFIFFKHGHLILSNLLPEFTLFFLLSQLVLFNLHVHLGVIYLDEPSNYLKGFIDAIKARLFLVLICCSLLLLTPLPVLLIASASTWLILRLYQQSLKHALWVLQKSASSTLIEWGINACGLLYILLSPIALTKQHFILFLIALDLLKIIFQTQLAGNEYLPPVLPRVDLTQLQQNASSFTLKLSYYLTDNILLIPALLFLPSAMMSEYFLILNWIILGKYIPRQLMNANAMELIRHNTAHIKEAAIGHLIPGSLFSLIWTMGGYLLLNKFAVLHSITPGFMLPVFTMILLSILNTSQTFILIKMRQKNKLLLLNILVIAVQLILSSFCLKNLEIQLCLWMFFMTCLLYSLGLQYFTKKVS